MRPTYYIRTLDPDLDDCRTECGQWSAQEGVPIGPHSLASLKRAAKLLQGMGYQIDPANPLDDEVQDSHVEILTEEQYLSAIEEAKQRIGRQTEFVRQAALVSDYHRSGKTLGPEKPDPESLFADLETP